MHGTARVVLAALAFAAVSAGCGGDDGDELSRSEYRAALLEIDTGSPESLYLDLVVRRRPQARCVRMMETFYEQVNGAVERVAALEPPADLASIHDNFVTAARQSVHRVGEIGDQVAAGEVSCGRPLNDRLYGMPSSDRADRAIQQMQQRLGLPSGY